MSKSLMLPSPEAARTWLSWISDQARSYSASWVVNLYITAIVSSPNMRVYRDGGARGNMVVVPFEWNDSIRSEFENK